jgi:very-short-patch-repair endonuclease
MIQPKRKKTSSGACKGKKQAHKLVNKKKPIHPKYGTSKLEDRFAEQFLDKLNIKYIRQFEAKEIGRFYDVAIFPKNGGMILLEIDGGYYHADPRVVNENELSPMQKRNKRIDELKNKWALLHGFPIIRIWEKDINENPSGVMKMLKERLYLEENKLINENKKRKGHRRIRK